MIWKPKDLFWVYGREDVSLERESQRMDWPFAINPPSRMKCREYGEKA